MTHLFPHLPHPSDLQWRVGAVKGDRCSALAYTDSRAIYSLLDNLGLEWSTNVLNVLPVGKEYAVTVSLTIGGMTRTDIGQDDDAMSAQSRGLKRAAMQYGIYRGLWELPSVWVAYDQAKQCITPAAIAKLNEAYAGRYQRLVADNTPKQIETATEAWQQWQGPDDAYQWALDNGVVNAPQHARNALKKLVTEKFDGKMTQTNWPHVAKAFFHNRFQREAEKAAA